jgi:hypothetical protein
MQSKTYLSKFSSLNNFKLALFFIDSIISRLLEGIQTFHERLLISLFTVRGAKPGKNVQLTENEIKGLCFKSREIFMSQPILLELEAPLKICGGQLMPKCLRG